MAKNTVKAEVHINDAGFIADIELDLADEDSAQVLKALIEGRPLMVHLLVGTQSTRREAPLAYAS
jgi:hypothetical protein